MLQQFPGHNNIFFPGGDTHLIQAGGQVTVFYFLHVLGGKCLKIGPAVADIVDHKKKLLAGFHQNLTGGLHQLPFEHKHDQTISADLLHHSLEQLPPVKGDSLITGSGNIKINPGQRDRVVLHKDLLPRWILPVQNYGGVWVRAPWPAGIPGVRG